MQPRLIKNLQNSQSFAEWLRHPWRIQESKDLLDAYNITFSGLHGQRVLQHILDNVYTTVYIGTDPVELAYHNARRSVVQDILQMLDRARAPEKYKIKIETTENKNG